MALLAPAAQASAERILVTRVRRTVYFGCLNRQPKVSLQTVRPPTSVVWPPVRLLSVCWIGGGLSVLTSVRCVTGGSYSVSVTLLQVTGGWICGVAVSPPTGVLVCPLGVIRRVLPVTPLGRLAGPTVSDRVAVLQVTWFSRFGGHPFPVSVPELSLGAPSRSIPRRRAARLSRAPVPRPRLARPAPSASRFRRRPTSPPRVLLPARRPRRLSRLRSPRWHWAVGPRRTRSGPLRLRPARSVARPLLPPSPTERTPRRVLHARGSLVHVALHRLQYSPSHHPRR